MVSADVIGQAAGVEIGDQFFGTSSRTIKQRVERLQTVYAVEVTKRFPGEVRIHITEYPRVAYQITSSGGTDVWFADGSKMAVRSGIVPDKPILNGWREDDPYLAKLCATLGGIPDNLMSDVSEIAPDPSIAYPDKIRIYTRSNFEVYTTIGYLPDKIQYLDIFVAQLHQNNIRSGMITMLESDQHAPFPEPEEADDAQDDVQQSAG